MAKTIKSCLKLHGVSKTLSDKIIKEAEYHAKNMNTYSANIKSVINNFNILKEDLSTIDNLIKDKVPYYIPSHIPSVNEMKSQIDVTNMLKRLGIDPQSLKGKKLKDVKDVISKTMIENMRKDLEASKAAEEELSQDQMIDEYWRVHSEIGAIRRIDKASRLEKIEDFHTQISYEPDPKLSSEMELARQQKAQYEKANPEDVREAPDYNQPTESIDESLKHGSREGLLTGVPVASLLEIKSILNVNKNEISKLLEIKEEGELNKSIDELIEKIKAKQVLTEENEFLIKKLLSKKEIDRRNIREANLSHKEVKSREEAEASIKRIMAMESGPKKDKAIDALIAKTAPSKLSSILSSQLDRIEASMAESTRKDMQSFGMEDIGKLERTRFGGIRTLYSYLTNQPMYQYIYNLKKGVQKGFSEVTAIARNYATKAQLAIFDEKNKQALEDVRIEMHESKELQENFLYEGDVAYKTTAADFIMNSLEDLSDNYFIEDIVSAIKNELKIKSFGELKTLPEFLDDLHAYSASLDNEFYGEQAAGYGVDERINKFIEKHKNNKDLYNLFKLLIEDPGSVAATLNMALENWKKDNEYDGVDHINSALGIILNKDAYEDLTNLRNTGVLYEDSLPDYEFIKKQAEKAVLKTSPAKEKIEEIANVAPSESTRETVQRETILNDIGLQNFDALIAAMRGIFFPEGGGPAFPEISLTRIAKGLIEKGLYRGSKGNKSSITTTDSMLKLLQPVAEGKELPNVAANLLRRMFRAMYTINDSWTSEKMPLDLMAEIVDDLASNEFRREFNQRDSEEMVTSDEIKKKTSVVKAKVEEKNGRIVETIKSYDFANDIMDLINTASTRGIFHQMAVDTLIKLRGYKIDTVGLDKKASADAKTLEAKYRENFRRIYSPEEYKINDIRENATENEKKKLELLLKDVKAFGNKTIRGFKKNVLEQIKDNVERIAELEKKSTENEKELLDKNKRIAEYKRFNRLYSKKVNYINSLKIKYKEVDRRNFDSMVRTLKVALAKDSFRKHNLDNYEYFNKLAEDKDLLMSAIQLETEFNKVARDLVRFQQFLRKRKSDVAQQKADALYRIGEDGKLKGPLPIIALDLGVDLYNKFKDLFLSGAKLVSIKSQSLREKLNELSETDRNKLLAAREVYAEFLAVKANRARIADIKESNNTSVYPEDIFNGNTNELKNKVAQTFYEEIAKAFGAKLTITSEPDTKSRYDATGETPEIIINIQDKDSYQHVMAHEVFHHIFNVAGHSSKEFKEAVITNIVDPETFERAVDHLVDTKNISLITAEEEVLAEIFAKSMGNFDFYSMLAMSAGGKGINTEAINRILDHLIRTNSFQDSDGFSMFEGQMLVGPEKIGEYQDLVHNLLGNANRMNTPIHNGQRYNTPLMGRTTLQEVDGYFKKIKKGVSAAWKNILSTDIKSYKDIMTKIEEILAKTRDYLKAHMPKFMYAHLGADNVERRIAAILVHGPEKDINKAKAQLAKYEKTFSKLTKDQKERMYDRVVKGIVLEDSYIDKETGKKVFKTRKLKPLDFRQEADVQTALEFGLTEEMVDAYKAMQVIADKQFKLLKHIYPELNYLPSHYSQSLRWFKDNMPIDDSYDAVIGTLEGSKKFLESKNMNKSTQQIAYESGSKYREIDPIKVALEYVIDSSKLIYTRKAIDTALIAKKAKKFSDDFSAKKERFFTQNNPAFDRLMPAALNKGNGYKLVVDGTLLDDSLYITEEDAIEAASAYPDQTVTIKPTNNSTVKTISGWQVVNPIDNTVVAEMESKQVAYDYLAFINQKTGAKNVVKPVFMSPTKDTVVERVYFTKGLNDMINTVTNVDHFKKFKAFGLTGQHALDLKNQVTSVEFALSMFHMMTIAPEIASSVSSITQQSTKLSTTQKIIKSNPFSALTKGVVDSRKLHAITTAVLEDPSVAEDPAVKQLMSDLLGTDNVDVMDLINTFFDVGGVLHLDESIRSSVHNFGKTKYLNQKPQLVVEGSNARIEFGDNRKVLTDIPKNVAASIKEVHKQQLLNEPNSPIKAMFNTVKYTGMQATTEWLMENVIPQAKLMAWMNEYTIAMRKNADAIESGKMTKQQIGEKTMRSVEDRFGEVNWKSQWHIPTVASSLKFAFRSFTWFTGSWFALGKGVGDVGKKIWYTTKGEKYELTTQGLWLFNVLYAHMAAAMTFHLVYAIGAGLSGGEEPPDEDVPLIYRMMFPRYDPKDPSARVNIPGYPSEAAKILHHLGVTSDEFVPFDIIKYRFNTVIGKSIDIFRGSDWRGVSVRDKHDSVPEQVYDSLTHFLTIAPISISSMYGDYKQKGFDLGTTFYRTIGLTNAPAFTTHSEALTKAYSLRRGTFSESSIDPKKASLRDRVRRAAYKYSKGDKTELNSLVVSGLISAKQKQNALAKEALIDGKRNPLYVDPLIRALKNTNIFQAVDIWRSMTENEKNKTRYSIMKKYNNYIRDNNSLEDKKKAGVLVREVGIIKSRK